MTTIEKQVLDNFLSQYKLQIDDITNFKFSTTDIEDKLSYSSYISYKKKYLDIPTARDFDGNDNRVFLERNTDKVKELTETLSDINKLNLINTGFYWYPPFSYCGWHTNSDNEGTRIYYIFSQEENKSFFRYIKDEEVITKYDNLGWTKNQFLASNKQSELNWHCVGSFTNRISIGFKVLENTKTTISLF